MTEEIRSQLAVFARKCDDVTEAPFLVATGKINELLRSVAALPAVVALLSEKTAAFHYERAKEACLLPAGDDPNKGVFLLPASLDERIPFLFCLLMDIDNRELDFSAFLKIFFFEDGSYTESYRAFADQVVRPFREAVLRAFQEKDEESKTPLPASETPPEEEEKVPRTRRDKRAIFSALPTLIEAERAALSASDLSLADIAAGKAMLAEAEKRAKKKDRDVLRAILTGYTYFLIATGREASTADKLLSVWEELQ